MSTTKSTQKKAVKASVDVTKSKDKSVARKENVAAPRHQLTFETADVDTVSRASDDVMGVSFGTDAVPSGAWTPSSRSFLHPSPGNLLSRKPALALRVREAKRVDAPTVQREEATSGESFEASEKVEDRMSSMKGGGMALPDAVCKQMGSRFGADFSHVRVHSDSQAAGLSRELGAQAFTHGTDIFFAEGQYSPTSEKGKHLIAHELTHVIQQGHAASSDLTPKPEQSVQRHPEGEELQGKETQLSEIVEQQHTAPEKTGEGTPTTPLTLRQPPSATRTKQEEKTEKKEGKEAGKEFAKSQKLSPGAMSLASAEKILQGAYGGLKKIVPGTIVILENQAACSAKYDEVCMADNIPRSDGSAWKAGDCALDDAAAGVQTEGFAWKGIVYVNGATTLVTATAHEILHNNTEPNFRAKVGETFNEGVTETLARKSLKDAGIKVPSVTAYPENIKLTTLLIDRMGLSAVIKAYFEDVETLVTAFQKKCSGTWDELVQAAEAFDTAKVKKALKKK